MGEPKRKKRRRKERGGRIAKMEKKTFGAGGKKWQRERGKKGRAKIYEHGWYSQETQSGEWYAKMPNIPGMGTTGGHTIQSTNGMAMSGAENNWYQNEEPIGAPNKEHGHKSDHNGYIHMGTREIPK